MIISPNFDALEKWAKQNGVAAIDRAKLVQDTKVQKVYKDIVGKANEGLAHHETIKKIAVVAEEWTRRVRRADAEPEAEAARDQ